MLEPYVLKETCTVLRGERNREVSDLPDKLRLNLYERRMINNDE